MASSHLANVRLFVLLAINVIMIGSTGILDAAPVTINPIADGSVVDANFDGVGDFIIDGLNSVLVGYNAGSFGLGEYRGVYAFDISQISTGPIVSATLGLNRVGTKLSGTDPNLTLFAGRGNAFLTASDFASGNFALGFLSVDLGPAPIDNILNVSTAVKEILAMQGQFIVFVVRPNPLASGGSGAILFSSTEQGVFSSQFGPAKLTIDVMPVPEPGTCTLVCLAFAAFVSVGRGSTPRSKRPLPANAKRRMPA